MEGFLDGFGALGKVEGNPAQGERFIIKLDN
jgi:hypothetical protein